MVSKKKAVTVGDLQTLDMDGPPKLFILSLPANAPYTMIQSTIGILDCLHLHETPHKFMLVRGVLDASVLSEEALAAAGLMRKLKASTPTANARPA
jgi:hypothetical protein